MEGGVEKKKKSPETAHFSSPRSFHFLNKKKFFFFFFFFTKLSCSSVEGKFNKHVCITWCVVSFFSFFFFFKLRWLVTGSFPCLELAAVHPYPPRTYPSSHGCCLYNPSIYCIGRGNLYNIRRWGVRLKWNMVFRSLCRRPCCLLRISIMSDWVDILNYNKNILHLSMYISI